MKGYEAYGSDDMILFSKRHDFRLLRSRAFMTYQGECFCGAVKVEAQGELEGMGMVDIFSATIPDLDFTPGVHITYAETVLPAKDGLPKFKDFPGGSAGLTSRWPSSFSGT